MISAKELRIKNWIQPAFNGIIKSEPVQVTGMFIRQIDALENSQAENYDPIPITPEVLEKCGFKHVGGGYYSISVGLHRLEIEAVGGDTFLVFDNDENPPEEKSIALQIETTELHQLQNLCYALTDNEIEYKP